MKEYIVLDEKQMRVFTKPIKATSIAVVNENLVIYEDEIIVAIFPKTYLIYQI
jgi:hypothetical protein